jgi:chemotaxis protein CheC
MDQEIRNISKLIRRGEHELVAKDYERALICFRNVYTLHPKNVTAIVNMGFCYAKLGKYSHAQKCFTTALDLNPHNIIARRNLARILRPGDLTAGVPSSYLDPFKKRAKPQEGAFVRYMELARSSRESGNLFSAVQYFEMASILHPEFIDPYLQAASCYEELNEMDHACSAYKRALSIYPSDTAANAGIKRCFSEAFNESETQENFANVKALSTPASVQSSSDDSIENEDMINDLLAQYADEIPADDVSADAADTLDAYQIRSLPAIKKFKAEPKSEVSDAQNTAQKPVILTDQQVDALSELGDIGASNTATTLSTMLGTTILMSVPEIKVMATDDVWTYVGDDLSAFAIFTMEGAIHQAGYVILQVAQESVIQMSAVMLGMSTKPREMDEMDESAIAEIGNIMVSAFLDGTAELLGIIMLPSPPQTVIGKATQVIRDTLDSSDINCDSTVLFKTEMVCYDFSIYCTILMMPSQSVLYNILEMLESIIEERQND